MNDACLFGGLGDAPVSESIRIGNTFMAQAVAKGKARERSRSCCALPSAGRVVGLTFAMLWSTLKREKQGG